MQTDPSHHVINVQATTHSEGSVHNEPGVYPTTNTTSKVPSEAKPSHQVETIDSPAAVTNLRVVQVRIRRAYLSWVFDPEIWVSSL
jgi:hypothetical protein